MNESESESDCSGNEKSVAVLHPELGIGGAERFVVDVGVVLKEAGYDVTMFATRHDQKRCFPATIDGTLRVRTYGGWFPIHLLGRLRAVFSILRTVWLALNVRRTTADSTPAFFSLLPFGISALKFASRRRVIYYCQFPDLLLTPRRTRVYNFYRYPIDWFERFSTCKADIVCVNSRFTAQKFRETIPQMSEDRLRVLYPGINCGAHAAITAVTETNEICLLSINRFVPDKQLQIAIQALDQLRTLISPDLFKRIRLVVAGGFDERLQWCSEVLDDLTALAARCNLKDKIEFVKTPSDAERLQLLQRCRCLIYTPENEHFGLIPLEAMASARPVVASNSGGPKETIIHGETGMLCPQSGEGFAKALQLFVEDVETAARFGEAGRRHVNENFSLERFGQELDTLMKDLQHDKR